MIAGISDLSARQYGLSSRAVQQRRYGLNLRAKWLERSTPHDTAHRFGCDVRGPQEGPLRHRSHHCAGVPDASCRGPTRIITVVAGTSAGRRSDSSSPGATLIGPELGQQLRLITVVGTSNLGAEQDKAAVTLSRAPYCPACPRKRCPIERHEQHTAGCRSHRPPGEKDELSGVGHLRDDVVVEGDRRHVDVRVSPAPGSFRMGIIDSNAPYVIRSSNGRRMMCSDSYVMPHNDRKRDSSSAGRP